MKTGIRTPETTAEWWARLKARKAQEAASPGPRPILTISEKRRLAQKASVAARRRNMAERRERARELDRWKETTLYPLLRGEIQGVTAPPSLSAEEQLEQRQYLEDQWRKMAPNSGNVLASATLYVNAKALAVVRGFLGRDPLWVRAWGGKRELQRPTSQPPKLWWALGGYLTLAMQIVMVRRVANPGAPYQHEYRFYALKVVDLLEHFERRAGELPAEAVPWDRAVPPVIELDDLPVPSPRARVREVKDYFRQGGTRGLTWRCKLPFRGRGPLHKNAPPTVIGGSPPRRKRGQLGYTDEDQGQSEVRPNGRADVAAA
jgi:hypothetical protein